MGTKFSKLCSKPQEEEKERTTKRLDVEGKCKKLKGKKTNIDYSAAEQGNECSNGDLKTEPKTDQLKQNTINSASGDQGTVLHTKLSQCASPPDSTVSIKTQASGNIQFIHIQAKEVSAHGMQNKEISYERDGRGKDKTNVEPQLSEEVTANEDNGMMINKLKDVPFAEDTTMKLSCEDKITESVGDTGHDSKDAEKLATYKNDRAMKQTQSGKVERNKQGKDKRKNVEQQLTEEVTANESSGTLVKELNDLPFADDSKTEIKLSCEDEIIVFDGDTSHDNKNRGKNTSYKKDKSIKRTHSGKDAKTSEVYIANNIQLGNDNKIIGQSIKKHRSNSDDKDGNPGRSGAGKYYKAENIQLGNRNEIIDQSVEEY